MELSSSCVSLQLLALCSVFISTDAGPRANGIPASNSAHEGCMSYLSNRMSSKYSTNQMENACNHYATWGDLMRDGPKIRMKPMQHDYWNKLQHTRHRPAVRKEYRTLSDDERQRFHNAINTLKNTMVGDMSQYDVLVGFHQASMAPSAHFGPAFLGWHREFVFRLETALQQIDSTVTIPYWDTTLDGVLGEAAKNTIMWSPQFMGNLDGDVVTGPFRYWSLFYPVQNRTRLFREQLPEGALFTDEIVDEIVNAEDFRSITWFVDPTFEVTHGMVHDWVGGVLGDLGVSPADPLFFLLHGFVDCTFESFRKQQLKRGNNVRYSYPNDSIAHGVGIANPLGDVVSRVELSLHRALRAMEPFEELINIDGLSSHYSRYFTCAPRPTCSRNRPKCGSKYLFCETKKEKCAPKLQEGAYCSKWANMDPCFNGVCCQGRCERTCNTAQSNTRSSRNREANPYQSTSHSDAPQYNQHGSQAYNHQSAYNPANQQPAYSSEDHNPYNPAQYSPADYSPAANNPYGGEPQQPYDWTRDYAYQQQQRIKQEIEQSDPWGQFPYNYQ